MIDSRAVIDSSAKLADTVSVGPFTCIGPDVEIGEGTVIASHVVIQGPTRIGRDNHIFQFSTVGETPPDKKFKGEEAWLEIGDRNVIREGCTLHRGTAAGGGITRIGDDNLLMAYTHVAHDCQLGNHIIMANNASLAGHVIVEDFAGLGGFSGVSQFCRLGAHSFLAMGSMVDKDVPPFIKASGYYAKPYGLNSVGLTRRGFEEETVRALKKAYRLLYRQGLKLSETLEALQEESWGSHPEVKAFAEFLKTSERGVIR